MHHVILFVINVWNITYFSSFFNFKRTLNNDYDTDFGYYSEYDTVNYEFDDRDPIEMIKTRSNQLGEAIKDLQNDLDLIIEEISGLSLEAQNLSSEITVFTKLLNDMSSDGDQTIREGIESKLREKNQLKNDLLDQINDGETEEQEIILKLQKLLDEKSQLMIECKHLNLIKYS